MNPANAGTIETDFRAKALYRNQWATVGNAYSTMYASYDMPVLKNDFDKKTLGVGMSFFSDKAGKSNWGRTEANINISQSVWLDNKNELSLGLAFTYGQISANFYGLKWDNQYDGTKYNATLPTGEANLNTSSIYFDMSAGVLWKTIGDRKNESNFGVSFLNALQPTKATLSSSNDRRNFRIIAHGKMEIPISEYYNNFIVPSLFYSQQAGSREITIGALYKTEIGMNSNFTGYYTSSYLYGGIVYRLQDAFVAVVKYDWQRRIQIGISYDINASKLKTASVYQGGIEVSLSWMGSF